MWEKSEGNGTEGWLTFVVMGMSAGLLVPLFLNTISSTLIKDVSADQSKLFVLIGFGVAAGTFAKQFLGSVAKKALELSRKASQDAAAAQKVAAAAESDAKNADRRALDLYMVLRLVDEDKVEQALTTVKEVLDADPQNAEAWAWRGYCEKRLISPAVAAESLEKALRIEGKDIFKWLYNLACYKCLAGAPVEEVMGILTRAKKKATPKQRQQLKTDLQEDPDFGRLAKSSEFEKFVVNF
jgi:tetratricopeptide (TPR) repeat protein